MTKSPKEDFRLSFRSFSYTASPECGKQECAPITLFCDDKSAKYTCLCKCVFSAPFI